MTNAEDGNIQDVTGLDDQAPAGPDSTGSHQGTVLGEGQLLSWAVEVGDTGDDESPLHKESTSVIDLAKIPHPKHHRCYRRIWQISHLRQKRALIGAG